MMKLKNDLNLIFCSLTLFTLLLNTPSALGKTLVYCTEGDPESFYPGINILGTSSSATEQIYDNLVQFEPGGTKVVPSLAEKWSISRDGLEYTFYLRKDVAWQTNKNFKPTRNFTADDAIFMFERQWKSTHPYYKISGSTHTFFIDSGLTDLLSSVEKINDSTLLVKLNRPDSPFLANLAMEFMGIQSKEYADAMLQAGTPEKIDLEPLGTGPFQLIEYQKNSLLKFQAFAAHWAGPPKINDLVFSITPAASQRWTKLQKGECHAMAAPAPEDLPAIQKDLNIKLLEQPGLNLSYMAYNTAKPPFRDVRVRRALNMAIDKKNIINLVYQGTAVLATNPIPPTMWGYNPTLKDEEFNPEQAKKLLEAAGYPNGFTTDLWAMPIARSYSPNSKLMAEIIQADLAKINVKVKIKSYPWEEYGKRMQNGEHQMGLYGWISDNADPDNFLHTLLGCESASTSGFNIAKFCYLPFDDLVIEAKYFSDIKERTKLYEKAQTIFKQQAPWFTIAHGKQIIPVRKEVLNYQLSPLERTSFRSVDISQ